jgi:hypothetical protein
MTPQPTLAAIASIAAALLIAMPAHAGPGSVFNSSAGMAAGGTASDAGGQTTLRLDVSPHAHVFYEPKPWRAGDPSPELAGVPQQRASLGLAFKSAPSGASGARSLLRVQLSGDSMLHFRPRGGGMTVTYKSQF